MVLIPFLPREIAETLKHEPDIVRIGDTDEAMDGKG